MHIFLFLIPLLRETQNSYFALLMILCSFLSVATTFCLNKKWGTHMEITNFFKNLGKGFCRATHNGTWEICAIWQIPDCADTVSHNILINRLRERLGISGRALDWFKFYLKDRSFQSLLKGQSVCSLIHDLWCSPRLSARTNTIYLIYANFEKYYNHISFLCRWHTAPLYI